MSRIKGYLDTSECLEDADGHVISETEVRIHYAFYPGSAPVIWGDAPDPGSPPTIAARSAAT